MNSKTEIHAVYFNKFKMENGDTGYTKYVLGEEYTINGIVKFVPKSIKLIKDRVHVTFEDGTKHVFGYLQDTELFYRPLKKEEPKKEED